MRFLTASAYVLLGLSAVASCYPAGTNYLPMRTTQSSSGLSPMATNIQLSPYAEVQTWTVETDSFIYPLHGGQDGHINTIQVTFEHPKSYGCDDGAVDATLYAKANTLLLINAAEEILELKKPYNVHFTNPSPCSKERARKSGFKLTININGSIFRGRVEGARGDVQNRSGSLARDNEEVSIWRGGLTSKQNLPQAIYQFAE
ncbi:hypothetical protein C8J55DRAFT_524493 [Lentinula edodes]|uniref:Uncharacterized protein n=1 Tax=Lentinula lateritia TaxID=40482 RepID=A0A9W9DFZ3_9AGAR|nr:hypothetical protein C8J55DRAFT_524493 [Lentinula edodes]